MYTYMRSSSGTSRPNAGGTTFSYSVITRTSGTSIFSFLPFSTFISANALSIFPLACAQSAADE